MLYELSFADVPFRIQRVTVAGGSPNDLRFSVEGSVAALVNPLPFRRAVRESAFPAPPGFEDYRELTRSRALGFRGGTGAGAAAPARSHVWLTGIVRDADGSRKAYLENRSSGEFHCVGAGDEVGSFRVERVDPVALFLVRGADRVILQMGEGADVGRGK
jgi:hypothetical protein